jgi:hypothetical protein
MFRAGKTTDKSNVCYRQNTVSQQHFAMLQPQLQQIPVRGIRSKFFK